MVVHSRYQLYFIEMFLACTVLDRRRQIVLSHSLISNKAEYWGETNAAMRTANNLNIKAILAHTEVATMRKLKSVDLA